MYTTYNPGSSFHLSTENPSKDDSLRRNSDCGFESSEKFVSTLSPVRFIKETVKSRRRRTLAKRDGISENPDQERILLTGYHGNWMTSWMRSHRKWKHLRQVRGSVGDGDNLGSCDNLANPEDEGREEDFLHRSTGEINEGQVDGFVLINHIITQNRNTHNSTGQHDGVDPHLFIANAIWRSQLCFCGYTIGDSAVSFDSLFPTSDRLKALVMDAVMLVNFRQVVQQMALLALRCGSLRLLRTILELGLLDVRHQFEGRLNMLHIGCVSQNFDVCLFLCTVGTHRRAKDKKGRTPYSVCRSDKIRKLLPSPHHKRKPSSDWSPPSHHNAKTKSCVRVEDVFSLVEGEGCQDELQILLQTKNVDAQDFVNKDGDYLVHVVTRKGLSHLASLLNLIRLQGHNLEQTNRHGMTSLMIAASIGNDVMCDVLICVLGADPNTHNKHTGYTALHYAAEQGHLKVICTLLQRGVNPNAETLQSLRADDLARLIPDTDCMNAIRAAQEARRKELTLIARLSRLGSKLLYETDLTVVDQLGDTLLMTAARHNRVDNIHILLSRKSHIIDAQNLQSGKTALSIAASLGHTDTVDALLCAGGNPVVRDMSGSLALHHAVMSGHVACVETLLERSSTWHDLEKALHQSPSPTITRMLKDAKNKRQEMLVCPALLEGAITGDVDLLYDTLEDGDDVNPISGDGNWPALVAAAGGHLDALQFLEQNGGNIWGKHEITKNTLLHVACANGHDFIADFLLRHYGYAGDAASRDMINSYNTFHKVALQLAADNGYRRTVRLLLDHGASTSLQDGNGQLYNCINFQGIQLLIQEARRRHLDDVIAAIKHPSNPVQCLKEVYEPSTDYNLRTVQGDSPLLVACLHGNPEVVKFLLQTLTDRSLQLQEVRRPNPRDGATSMHRAVQGGDHVTVLRLLAAVDETLVNSRDQNGQTPLHLTCLLNRRHTAEKLMGMPGIDVNAVDVNGRKPDDVTNSSSLRHMISAVRRRQGGSMVNLQDNATSPSTPNIDFDDLNRRFLSIKTLHANHQNGHVNSQY